MRPAKPQRYPQTGGAVVSRSFLRASDPGSRWKYTNSLLFAVPRRNYEYYHNITGVL